MSGGHRTRSSGSSQPQGHEVWIDESQQLAIAESGVGMQQLVRAALAKGLVPLVVPEFKSITVGGAIAGGALESSSFRYGQFHDTCVEYELLCGESDRIEASWHLNQHLFHAVSGSYGAFGRIVRAVVRLREARAGVHVRYTECHTAWETIALLHQLATAKERPDYLDAVGLSADRWLVMAATLSDGPEGLPEAHFRHSWSDWYIDHLASGVQEEWIPLEEYLFRYDRGAFWMGRHLVRPLHQIPGAIWEWLWSKPELADRLARDPAHAPGWFRALFGWLTSSDRLYQQLHHLDGEFFFIQDAYVPLERGEEALSWCDRSLKLYPIWLCPVKGTERPQLLSPAYSRSPLLLNIGLYGAPGGSIGDLTGQFERLVADLGGRKMLYGLNTYTAEQFWQIYDRYSYEQLHETYGSAKLMDGISSHSL